MKKKFSVIFVIMALVLTFSSLNFSTSVKALANNDNKFEYEIKSKSAYLIEPYSKTVLYKYNENEKLPIASMCKIMTLLLCFEALDCGDLVIDEKITISENASSMGGSQVFLEANGEYSVNELIKSIVVASANDACVAMAERICGSQSSFVDKMNEKASELNMNNTVFVNCTGLPQVGQYSCAKDASIMFCELIKHKDYFNYSKIWTDKVEHPNDRYTEISNTNKLIRFYQGCDGGKTGYTSEAGHCLTACAFRNGMRLVSVVISSPDSKTRFKEVSEMFNYGFANYCNKMVVDDKKPLDVKVEIVGGKKDSVEVVAEKPIFIFSSKNEKKSVEINFEPFERVKAPIYVGDFLGKLIVYENGKEIASVNVISNEEILQKTFFDVIKDISSNWAII